MRHLTSYERLRLLLEPFFPPLYAQVRRHLLEAVKFRRPGVRMLDVGCRTSPYTIGVPARLVLTDLPKTTEIQVQYYLGLTGEMVRRLYEKRSNVELVLFDDMTCSSMKTGQFGCVIAVEVLEHVERDDLFVAEVQRVLEKGGVFLMTTPNGDYVVNKYPDHKRHYTREQLRDLLSMYFEDVQVDYTIRSGRFFKWGHDSWSPKHPLRTAKSMASNFASSLQSRGDAIRRQGQGTAHLIAVARKSE